MIFLVLRLGRLISRRKCRAFAEEVVFHLLEQEFLGFLVPRFSRYSFMIIFMCSSHSFQASLETLS